MWLDGHCPGARTAYVLCVALLGSFPVAGSGAEARVAPELVARAEAEGSVRVIVELRVGSEGIGAAQDAVLRALAGARHRVTQRFSAIPFLALEASAEALHRLANLTEVIQVREDRLHAPQGKTP